jgi:two-component system, NtrC family, response regulator AtoC
MARILVADDEPGIREFIEDSLALDGHDVVAVADGRAAARRLGEQGFELLITDLNMPEMGGMELLRSVRAEQPEVEVIVLTAHGTVDTAVEAMKLGAFEFLQKPIGSPDELRLLAARALERRALRDREAGAARDDEREPPLTYGDPVMEPVVRAIEKVAPVSATVLLLGESGTGKEVAARAIHRQSERRDKPFSAINCAALTETLLESELFGHEKGAFTGAHERRRGRLELADGGTFFLDEVGELRPELQAKLLRVLQERRFERVGGTQTLQVDVRWIAATNRDLQEMIGQGQFREDLYHRLAVFPIRLPALRGRSRDLAPMAARLLDGICRDLKRRPLSLSPEAIVKLEAWSFPGNVRELANVLERAAILADGDTIEPGDLWLEGGQAARPAPIGTLADLERDAISRALDVTGGNRRRAAEMLGIGERTLYDKLKRYALA